MQKTCTYESTLSVHMHGYNYVWPPGPSLYPLTPKSGHRAPKGTEHLRAQGTWGHTGHLNWGPKDSELRMTIVGQLACRQLLLLPHFLCVAITPSAAPPRLHLALRVTPRCLRYLFCLSLLLQVSAKSVNKGSQEANTVGMKSDSIRERCE